MKKVIYFCLIFLILLLPVIKVDAKNLFPEKEKYVIVIDPGHGGENFGTTSNENFLEKDIIMQTALSLVEELKKYDNLEVYLTHDEDIDMSLTERAIFAKKVNADFLFSLHYNASENHTMFGTEVWIPLRAPYHNYCYKFAYLQQLEMQELGLFSRGIKTRKNETDTDYYGIIRDCVARNIPAVIIEHCYVDEERDETFCDDAFDYAEFGRRDAIAIAKFLGLYEEEDSIPQHLFEIKEKDIISNTYEDFTGPNTCKIEVESADYENGVLTIKVSATEKQTQVMYYSYSIDGGKTFSKLYAWPNSNLITGEYDSTFSLMLNIPDGYTPKVLVRAYNKFDIYKTSNKLSDLETFISPTAPPALIDTTPLIPVLTAEQDATSFSIINLELLSGLFNMKPDTFQISVKRFFLLLIFVLFWIFLLIIMLRFVLKYLNKNSKTINHFKTNDETKDNT